MGMVYKRGKTWWIQYYQYGRLFRESSRSKQKTIATALLKKKEGDVVYGRLPAINAQKTTFEDLTILYIQDYRINKRKSLETALVHVKNLKKTFTNLRAVDIATQRINDHITLRQKEGRSNATINRELTALKRMFNLAFRQQPPLVGSVPYIPPLKGENIRQGFFEDEDYRVLLAALPDHVKIPALIGYWTGLRKGEILSLQWEKVDLDRGVIRKEPGTTKNQEGREVPLVPEVHEVLMKWRQITLKNYPYCTWVCHFKGQRMKDFRTAWKNTCKRIGIKDRRFHDFRRSAVRNMVQAGIPEIVAMKITGHKTRNIFDRYAIVSNRDLELARMKLTDLAEKRAVVRNLQKQEENPGMITDLITVD